MLLTERYPEKIRGVLSCFDRVIITGTLPDFGHAQAATGYLHMRQIRIFDFAAFAKPLRDAIRANAEQLAREAAIEIEYLRKPKALRKDKRIAEILAQRGDAPGLVHIFSVMETCTTYEPWHDKRTHRTFLRPDSGKCVHYYFYFIDAEFGLCYLRVPTWAPYRLQFYFNGHNWLAAELRKRNIGFRLADNVFVQIDDFVRAQKMADRFRVKRLHVLLNQPQPAVPRSSSSRLAITGTCCRPSTPRISSSAAATISRRSRRPPYRPGGADLRPVAARTARAVRPARLARARGLRRNRGRQGTAR